MAGSEDAQMTSDRRVGQRFGDFLVEAVIGRGGMGVVFRASHVVSGDVVALKLMAPDLADNAVFRDRFVREAEAGPNLVHPNIVRVFESGEADGELFIAMELIDGTDLKGLIQQEGSLDPKRALSIFRQAASALDAAHESGMVHRDVKPQNILVIPRSSSESADRVYLTDFGLVRPMASESSATRTGQVFGSVPYMAPELIEGIPADGRADVYALACVVYESLTGSIPFERDNEVSAVWAHIHEDPPLLTDKRRNLPGGLNDVVFRAMSKHPDDRYLTCGEFVAELEVGLGRKLSAIKYSHVRPLVARIPRRKTEREVWAPNFFPELSRVRAASRERFDWRKAAALLAAVALLSSIQVGRDGGIPRAVADVADAADSAVDSAVDAVVEPDGNPEPGDAGERGGDKNRDLTTAGREEIHKSDRKKLKALLPADPPTGGNETGSEAGVPQPLAGAGKIAWARSTIGDTGNTTSSDIWVMDPDGTNEVNLTRTDLMEFWPSWSPDGAHIAFVIVRPPDVTAQDLWVMDADGSNRRDLGLCPGVGRCGKLAWSPDGRRVGYAQGNDLWMADLASGTRELLVSGGLEEPNPITGGRGSGPSWSPDGKSLAFECGDDLCVVAADGGEPRVIGPGLGDPEWSPEGDLLVGEDWPTSGERAPDLVIHRLHRNRQDQLIAASQHTGVLRFPTWAPDGREIVYTDERSLFKINRDGTGRVRLTSGPQDLTPDWGPSPAG